MKILSYLLLFISITFAQNLKNYPQISNEKNEIIVLEIIDKDIEDFLLELKEALNNPDLLNRDKEKDSLKFNLKLLTITKNKSSIMENENWARFIQENASKLEKVILSDFNSAGDVENLIAFLDSFKGIKIKSFHWTNQSEINSKIDIDRIAAYEDFWSNLEELSFKNTELLVEAIEEEYLISSLNLKNLKHLDLTNTDLNQLSLQKLINHAATMPKLKTLILDRNPDLLKANIKGNIPSLDRISFILDDEISATEYHSFTSKNKSLISDLNSFYLNAEYLDEAKNGPFKFDDDMQIPSHQSIIQRLVYRSTHAKSIGYFYRDITTFNKTLSNSFSAQALVIITEEDLESYSKAFPDKNQEFVQFVGHELSFDKIMTFLKSKSFKQIFFIDSFITSAERDFIRASFSNSIISYIDNDFNRNSKNDAINNDLNRPFLIDLNYLFNSINKANKTSRRR